MHYRKLLVSKRIGEIDNSGTTTPVNIKEAINWIGEAWEHVNKQTILIYNCWKKPGILPENQMLDELDNDSLIASID